MTEVRTPAPDRDGGAVSRSPARWPWHTPLFAALVVVSFWMDTAVSPYAAFRSLGVAVVAAILVTVLAAALARSLQVGGIVASAIIGLLWTRQILRLGGEVVDRMGALVAIAWLLLVAAVLVVGLRLLLRRARWTRGVVTVALNRAAAFLLVATVLLGLLNGRFASAVADLDQGVDLAAWQAPTVASRSGPDVYAILLDGYPRADVLRYAIGLDNGAFLSALEDRGFDVAEASHSDYLWTHVSVPSALNMAYVEQIPSMAAVAEGRAPRQPTLRRTIADNAVFDVAREHGYATVAVASGFEEVAARQADVWVDGGHLNEFELSLLVQTWLGDGLAVLAPDFASSQHRARILHDLEVLPEIAATNAGSPRLVFAHVPAPHSPIVFGAGGAPVPVPLRERWYGDSPMERGQDPETFVAQYAAQLPYLNERILEAVDGILAASDEPPIIVLFADHGSASRVDWNETEPGEADPARLLERTGILFAAFTPGRTDVFPDDISPVDIFRLLFDAYLGTDYGRATPPENGGQVPPVDASVLDE